MAKSTRRNLIKVAAAGGVSAALGLTSNQGAKHERSRAPSMIMASRYRALWLRQLSALGNGQQARRWIDYWSTIQETETSTSSYLTKSQSRQVEP